MSDPRAVPVNGHVALRGWEDAAHPGIQIVDGTRMGVHVPVSDLCRGAGGPRDRQLCMGDSVVSLDQRDGWHFVRCERDGYVGYLRAGDLGPSVPATHRVSVRATHVYPEPDFKARELCGLSFGSLLAVAHEHAHFFETTDGGFIPKPHLRPVDRPFTDPATVAQLFFGTPYLWGGNTSWGIDCSGLIQAALLACDMDCPGDSDQQEALGVTVEEDTCRRGDLFFWDGHVAMALDGETLIHANAHHMAVTYEPRDAAIARIMAQGDGPVTAHRRIG